MTRHIVPAAPAAESDPRVTAFLDQYIDLYTRDTLPRWIELFLPGAAVAAVNADGSVATWSREAFYARQRATFEGGKPIREILENTRADRTGPLVSVRSNFGWTDGTLSRRGRLMLLLVEQEGQLKATALTFTYLA